MTTNTCSKCGGENLDLRPYGKDGALVCFKCATSTPEGEAIAKARFLMQFQTASEHCPILVGFSAGSSSERLGHVQEVKDS